METIYQSYPVRRGETRLLEVYRAPFSRRLSCHFVTARLDQAQVPRYTAISYAWGESISASSPAPAASTPTSPSTSLARSTLTSQSKSKSKSRIQFPGKKINASLPLSETVTDLLTSLLKPSPYGKITVWIDAICINQSDDGEKAIQVDQMGEVYSLAEQVVVWLGNATRKSRVAFGFMQSKRGVDWPWPTALSLERHGLDQQTQKQKHKSRGKQRGGISVDGIEAVFRLLERTWFRRLWVIQEVALSSKVIVACGDDRVDFSTFENCVNAVWAFSEGVIDCDGDDAALLGLWSVTRLMALRNEFQQNGQVPWERLLQAASQRLTTDSRDMVFAFRSMADKGRPLPKTDYGVDASTEKLFTDTAIALLCNGECLDLLALAGSAQNGDSSLPSWVPDYRNFTWSEPFTIADGMEWNAGGPFRSSPTISLSSPLGLELEVYSPLGRIAETCQVFKSWDVLHQQTVMQELLTLRPKFRRQPLSEKEWLEMLAMSLIFGLDLDDQKAQEEEYREYFTEWLEWLVSSTSQADLAAIKHNKYHRTIGPRLDDWRAFLTADGFFGIGPPEVALGDMVCLVPGCRLPLVLRSLTDLDSGGDMMALIGWCFVEGIMDGEGIKFQEVLEKVLLR